jgi:hypothetical protein
MESLWRNQPGCGGIGVIEMAAKPRRNVSSKARNKAA